MLEAEFLCKAKCRSFAIVRIGASYKLGTSLYLKKIACRLKRLRHLRISPNEIGANCPVRHLQMLRLPELEHICIVEYSTFARV